jgi:hypothetical protein
MWTTNKESYYRVKLDGYKLYAEGHQCMANFVRPINEAALKASGKYKVGDAIEAKNSNGSWLPAKIIGIEGAFYKVSFESCDNRYDEKIDEERISPIGAGEKDNVAKETPKTGSVPHSLIGTA